MVIVGLIFVIIAYLLGSLNSAVITSKLMNLPDPRSTGSGNPGATNVLRTSGKTPALVVLLIDALKGFIPVLLARVLGVEGFMLALVALAAVIGHIFPAFFQFKGGKGVATAFGALFALSFMVALICLIVWFVVVFVTRYVSLASLISLVLAAVLILFVHTSYFLPVAAMVAFAIWKHRENIDRLKAKTEPKIDFNDYKK